MRGGRKLEAAQQDYDETEIGVRDFSPHFRGLLEGLLPKGARVLMPRGGADLILLASWNLPREPGRAARRSRMVRIVMARDALESYAAGDDLLRRSSDMRLVSHWRSHLASFDPNHDTPLGVEPPSVTWAIDALTLNGFYHDSELSLKDANRAMVRVTYMEMREPPAQVSHDGPERITEEKLAPDAYLDLYRRVGEPVGWDARLKLSAAELATLLAGPALQIYVLRDADAGPLGFCEFDRQAFPDVELKNFGLIPQAQGRKLGPCLLTTAILGTWRTPPTRLWLHTDTWDHPAAMKVYEKAGFKVFDVRDERADTL